MAKGKELENIKQMLASGDLSIPGKTKGSELTVYAPCPRDGYDSAVYRINLVGEAITHVLFRCPSCGEQFFADAKKMFLKEAI